MQFLNILDVSGMGDDLEKSDSDDSTSSSELTGNGNLTNLKRRKIEKQTKNKRSQLVGGSSEDTFINKIVDLVTQKIKSSDQKTGGGLELSPPTAELVPVLQSPPLPFNNTITKNDDNDKFGKISHSMSVITYLSHLFYGNAQRLYFSYLF